MEEMKEKYRVHKAKAKHRGIDFNFTFEEWKDIWINSGHWHDRGWGANKYCMSRYNDIGPYEVGNVFIQTNGENISQAQMGHHRSYGPFSDEHKRKIGLGHLGTKRPDVSLRLKGKPQTEEHKQKNREAQLRNSKLKKETTR